MKLISPSTILHLSIIFKPALIKKDVKIVVKGATWFFYKDCTTAAAHVKHWSAVLNGMRYDFETFKVEADTFMLQNDKGDRYENQSKQNTSSDSRIFNLVLVAYGSNCRR